MSSRESEGLLQIDLDSPVPVHRQIVNGLRAALVSGVFPASDHLPTMRDLAMSLGINHNTVADAYRILADEGWISLKRRSGALVLQRALPPRNSEAGATFSRRLSEILAEARASGAPKEELLERMRTVAEELGKGMSEEGG